MPKLSNTATEQTFSVNKKNRTAMRYFWEIKLVGAEGFEPSTFCSRSKRATRLRYAPTHNPSSGIYCCVVYPFLSNQSSTPVVNFGDTPPGINAYGIIP